MIMRVVQEVLSLHQSLLSTFHINRLMVAQAMAGSITFLKIIHNLPEYCLQTIARGAT